MIGRYAGVAGIVLLGVLAGCANQKQSVKMRQELQALREQNQQLQDNMQTRDASLANLQRQVQDLQALGPKRKFDLFAPVKIEIVARSGGSNFDDKPGDDGVTVYVRPIDADGDAVKVPGELRLQVVDHSDLANPRVVALCEYKDLDEVQRSWYGRLGSQHYTLKCPFASGAALPESRKLEARVEFLDYLTGSTLTASKELSIDFPTRP